jgi:hypothetical protein
MNRRRVSIDVNIERFGDFCVNEWGGEGGGEKSCNMKLYSIIVMTCTVYIYKRKIVFLIKDFIHFFIFLACAILFVYHFF